MTPGPIMQERGNAEELEYRGALFKLLELDALEVAITITSGDERTRVRIRGELDLGGGDEIRSSSLARRLAATFGPQWREVATLRLATATGSLALQHRGTAAPALPAMPSGDLAVDVDGAAVSLTIRETQLDRAWFAHGPAETGDGPLAVGLAMADGTTLVVQELPADQL